MGHPLSQVLQRGSQEAGRLGANRFQRRFPLNGHRVPPARRRRSFADHWAGWDRSVHRAAKHSSGQQRNSFPGEGGGSISAGRLSDDAPSRSRLLSWSADLPIRRPRRLPPQRWHEPGVSPPVGKSSVRWAFECLSIGPVSSLLERSDPAHYTGSGAVGYDDGEGRGWAPSGGLPF